MAFLKVTSPHASKPGNAGNVMTWVILATVPGVLALTYYFGIGSLLNIFLASIFALLFEACALFVRGKPVLFYLKDYSAMVTAVLLGIALPPYCPWWVVACGMFFSIVVAKQLYGGLGYNPFNPAMVGYVVLLISFPLEMSQWAAPTNLIGGQTPSIADSLAKVFFGSPLTSGALDGYTAATPLELLRQNQGATMADMYFSNPQFQKGFIVSAGWDWVNIGFLLGGFVLLYKRIFTWHAPVGMLATIAILSALFNDGGSSSSLGSPLFHLFTGATMFGAFFIVTDPVSSTVSNTGRLIFGALVGLLVFVLRSYSNYPDGVAFAVLLLNFAAPFIDYYTQPRAYGHKRKTLNREDER